ncbi:MAG: type II secretion system protein [Sedimentisphaerales bacterium]|nr:type II secretion system protein [Sedimentisphaerales bacterium]
MKRRAFTLIELMAAVGMLAMIIAFTSIIFKFGIDAHRVSVANAEIMRNARAITEQLNADFKGLRKDAPLLIWFEQDNTYDDPNRYDQILFFASGDFSSLQLYDKNTREPLYVNDAIISNQVKVIRGNLARIQYAHATNADDADIEDIRPIDRILSRRTHILYSNPKNGFVLQGWPDFNNLDRDTEDYYEHDTITMADWKNADRDYYRNEVIPNIFVDYHPKIDKTDADTLHLLLCEKVSSFTVQWAYWGKDEDNDSYDWELRWFPSDNPSNDKTIDDSHFKNYTRKYDDSFGVYFNVADIDANETDWYDISLLKEEWDKVSEVYDAENYPFALKFTFTIYDKNNFIEGGRTFTHIVYLED